jgi:FkbM family methyltransferase
MNSQQDSNSSLRLEMEENSNIKLIKSELIPLLLHFQGVLAWQISEEAGVQTGQEELSAAVRDSVRARFLKALLKIVEIQKPAIVVEIGAHEASFSKEVKHLLPSAQVIAFEANPEVFNKFEQRVAAVGVDYRHACVATHDGYQTFHAPLSNKGNKWLKAGSMLGGIHGSKTESYQVPACRLDTVLGSMADNPSVIWIDVEGAIAQVLGGANKTLKNCRALYVELETQRWWDGQMIASEAVELLINSGLYPVLQDFQKDGQANYLFLSEDMILDRQIIGALNEALSTRAPTLRETRLARRAERRARRQRTT